MEKKLLEKIQKLLNLANSDNEHEAKLAMERANELLVKHNISMQQATVDLEYEKTVLTEDSKQSTEDKFVRSILSEFFFVKLVTSRRTKYINSKRVATTTIFILGTDTNVQIATYVYGYLKNTFKSLFKQYKKETGCPANVKQSYYAGLYDGLKIQLEATKVKVEQKEGLVLVDDKKLARYMAGAFDNLKTQTSRWTVRDSQAVQDGTEQGKNIRIARGIESNGQAGLCLKGK